MLGHPRQDSAVAVANRPVQLRTLQGMAVSVCDSELIRINFIFVCVCARGIIISIFRGISNLCPSNECDFSTFLSLDRRATFAHTHTFKVRACTFLSLDRHAVSARFSHLTATPP